MVQRLTLSYRLSLIAPYPGATIGHPRRPLRSRRHVITGTEVDQSGNTWIAARPAKDQPSARGTVVECLRHLVALRVDHERRSALQLVCHGGYGAAMIGAMLLVAFVPTVWLATMADPAIGVCMGLALLAVVSLVFTLPWPERWRDAREVHMNDMKALQARQGW